MRALEQKDRTREVHVATVHDAFERKTVLMKFSTMDDEYMSTNML